MARLGDKFKERALSVVGTAGRGEARGVAGPDITMAASSLNPLLAQRDTLTDLPLSQIEPDPTQPRKDLGDLSELKASIASVGIVQPIIVSIVGYERYRLIAGERRFTAAKELDLAIIPAIVRTVEEHQRLELQIVENLHRKDLNPFEEAESYKRLMEEFGLNQEAVGKRIGKSQASVNELLRLLDLPEQVREEYRTSDKISKSLLLEIVKRPHEEQPAVWEQAKQGQLTVRKARESKAPSGTGQPSPPTTTPAPMSFRYPIQTEEAVVTVSFNKHRASQEEIIAALEEALSVEKARIS